MLQTLGHIIFNCLLLQTNVYLVTDCWWGERDPFGPYPRIPDKDLVKREIEFAKECRKFITAPKPTWIR